MLLKGYDCSLLKVHTSMLLKGCGSSLKKIHTSMLLKGCGCSPQKVHTSTLLKESDRSLKVAYKHTSKKMLLACKVVLFACFVLSLFVVVVERVYRLFRSRTCIL